MKAPQPGQNRIEDLFPAVSEDEQKHPIQFQSTAQLLQLPFSSFFPQIWQKSGGQWVKSLRQRGHSFVPLYLRTTNPNPLMHIPKPTAQSNSCFFS